MRVKQYQASSLEEALRLVRNDLGRDAIILETHRVRAPGIRGLFTPPMLTVSAVADNGEVRVPWDSLSKWREAEIEDERQQRQQARDGGSNRQKLAQDDQAGDAPTLLHPSFQPGVPMRRNGYTLPTGEDMGSMGAQPMLDALTQIFRAQEVQLSAAATAPVPAAPPQPAATPLEVLAQAAPAAMTATGTPNITQFVPRVVNPAEMQADGGVVAEFSPRAAAALASVAATTAPVAPAATLSQVVAQAPGVMMPPPSVAPAAVAVPVPTVAPAPMTAVAPPPPADASPVIKAEIAQLHEALAQVREALSNLSEAQAHILRQVAGGPVGCPAMDRQFAAPSANDRANATVAGLQALMDLAMANGIDQDVAVRLAEEALMHLPEGADDYDQLLALSAALERNIPVLTDDGEPSKGPRVVFLVGGTGVGKTTAGARLAGQLASAGQRVALVMLGSSGFTGTSLLVTHCVRQGAMFRECSDLAALQSFLDKQADRFDWVIVDSRGMSYKDGNAHDTLAAFRAVSPTPQVLLVTSTATHGSVVNEIVRAVGTSMLDGLMLTKLDEPGALGSLASAAIRHQLPVRYLSSGHVLTDGVRAAGAAEIAINVMGGTLAAPEAEPELAVTQ